ncbi:MAG: nuclear transport factor 2 family protein [Actinomycetes bacterium]
MTAPDPAALARTVDEAEIRSLQQAYADVVNRRAWGELHDLFRPDLVLELDLGSTTLRVDGPDGVGGFIGERLEEFDYFQFVVLSSVVALAPDGDPDHATARLYMCELRHAVADGRFTIAYGIYHDVHRRVDGRWWFAGRRYNSWARTAAEPGRALDVFAFPHHLALDALG